MKLRDSWKWSYEMENSTGYTDPAVSPERQEDMQEQQHPDCRRHWVGNIRRLGFLWLAAAEACGAQRDVVDTGSQLSGSYIYHTDEAHRTFLSAAYNFRRPCGDGKTFAVGRGWLVVPYNLASAHTAREHPLVVECMQRTFRDNGEDSHFIKINPG